MSALARRPVRRGGPRGVTVRTATADDHRALLALYEELDERHRCVRPDDVRAPEGERRSRAWLTERIDGPDSVVFVAEQGADLVGLTTVLLRHQPAALVRSERRFALIDKIVVRESHRRRGIASALLEAAMGWARGRPSVDAVELPVWEFNAEAIAFYRANGFETASRRMERTLEEMRFKGSDGAAAENA